MLVVTGTHRSGTSMWMQALDAAGFSIIGEAFPRDWSADLASANPHGFYESQLREGIYYATNPDPRDGRYLSAEDSRLDAVKVFIPGLVRSERAYLDRVLATVRPWREYVASVRRMWAIEDARTRAAGEDPQTLEAMRMPPELSWWHENFALLTDMSTRGYACHVQSFDGMLEDPRGVLTRVFAWLGEAFTAGRDLEAAIKSVRPGTRTQSASPTPEPCALEPAQADVCDAYYQAVHAGSGLGTLLVERMNEVQLALDPIIASHRTRIEDEAYKMRELWAGRTRRFG